MKKVSAKLFYSVDMATLMRAFNDVSVIQAKAENSGAKDIHIDLQDTADGFDVVIKRTMPADVPSALKKFLREWNHVTQKESWTGSEESGYSCKLSIDIEGVPVNISGTFNITSSGLLKINVVEIAVKCGIPLLGGQLEKFVASNFEKSMDQELKFLKSHLD